MEAAEAILVRLENRFPDCSNKVIEYFMSHFLARDIRVQLTLQLMRQDTRM